MPPEPPHEPVRRQPDDDSGGDNHMRVAGMIVGTALIFIGFLDVFLSISGGFEIDVIPFMIYFGGVAVWANSVVENTTLRFSLIGGAISARSRILPLWGSPLLAQASVCFGPLWLSSCISCSTNQRDPR